MKLSIPSKTGLMLMIELPAGAESAYYAFFNPPYEAKNAPLDCIEELLMVKGITNEIFTGQKKNRG
jgi:general secretion pathway protein K